MNTAQRSVDNFARSGSEISRGLGATNRALNDAGRSASTFGSSFANQATTANRGFSGLVTGVVGGAARMTAALAPLAGGVALAGFATSAVNTRVTFERELANVGALARATTDEVAQLSAQAEALGASTAFGATDVLQGQQFLAVAGFEVPDIIEALPGLLSTASAAQEDLATTSDIVSNALSGFNLAASETGRVSDVLVAGLTGSNTNLQQLGTALSFAAPDAAALGVTIEETAAAIGILSNAGIQSSRAGTTLRGVLVRLASPTAEAAAEMQRLGINAFTAEGQLKELPDVVAEFERGLDGLNDQQRAESLNTIVGTIAGTGFTALLSAGSDQLRDFTTELENSGGVAEQVAGRQLDNLAGDITKLSSAYEGLQLAVTRRATPALRTFFQGLTSGVSALTFFTESLNQGDGLLTAFSIGLQDIAPNASFALGALNDITDAALGLSNINLNLDGLFGFDTLRVFRFEDFFSFEVGDLSGIIRGAFDEVSINLGDFVSFDFVSGESLSLNIADFITFDSTDALTQLSIGDFINFTSEDVSSLFSDATANITKLTIGDFIDFTATTGPAGSTINVNDVIVGTYDLANNITTIAISDLITGTLDLSTGQGSVTLGEDLTFEFDLGALQTQVQDQLTAVQTGITAALSGEFTFELPDIGTALQAAIDTALGGIALTFAIPALTAGQAIDIEIPAPLLNFTIPDIATREIEVEIPAPALNFLAPVLGDATAIDIPVPEALLDLDFGNIAGGLGEVGNALAGLDEGLSGATGGDSALASFVTLINEQIGGLATTLDGLDAGSIGESLTGVITSLTGIFTTLNTIDDLALGGIAGSLGSLTESILNFATEITAGIDADAVGEAIAQSASTFIASFGAVLSEPDLPGIGVAAAGLVAGIGEQLRAAFEPGNFTVVGASIGQLASTLVEQLSATLSDPQIGADIGQGLADIIVGITQGLADTLDGLAAETEGAGAELSGATTSFVSNLISALAAGLADANYGAVVSALLEGIGNSLTSLVPGFSGGVFGSGLGGIAEQTFAEAGLTPSTEADGGGGFGGPATEAIDAAAESVSNLSTAASSLAETTSQAATAAAELETATPEQGFFGDVLGAFGTAFGFGGGAAPVEEARRTGLGTGAAFDEADIAGSVQDQILSQLNFGDLPDTIATATTEAIATAIPAESIIDADIVTDTLTEAVSAAIPAEPVIDADTVNETLLTAAQEAIPASEVPAFPGWREVLDFRAPTIPRFPSWRQVLNIRVPRIPGFPGWGAFINFDIPSIPSFPGWEALTGSVDLATLVPPFPGWASLINVDVRTPNVSCELSCGGGGGGGGGGSSGGGGSGGSSGSISPFQTGTTNFAGGLALVSERGDEAIILPSGEVFIAQGEQILNLPSGTQIVNASQTDRLLDGQTATVGSPVTAAAPSAAIGASAVSSASLSQRALGGAAVAGRSGRELDENRLATGIVDAFADAFDLPGFPGWRSILSAPDINVPAFPGWNSIVGLDDISVQIFRSETIIREETSSDDGGRDITVGPITPIPISIGAASSAAAATTTESESAASTTTTEATTSTGAGTVIIEATAGLGAALSGGTSSSSGSETSSGGTTNTGRGSGATFAEGLANESIVASGIREATNEAARLVQSPPSVTNVTNNVINNFNLATSSLRSTERVEDDFAMMTRLEALARRA